MVRCARRRPTGGLAPSKRKANDKLPFRLPLGEIPLRLWSVRQRMPGGTRSLAGRPAAAIHVSTADLAEPRNGVATPLAPAGVAYGIRCRQFYPNPGSRTSALQQPMGR